MFAKLLSPLSAYYCKAGRQVRQHFKLRFMIIGKAVVCIQGSCMHPGQQHASRAFACIQGSCLHLGQSHAFRAVMCIKAGTDNSLMLDRESVSLSNTAMITVTNRLSANMQRGCEHEGALTIYHGSHKYAWNVKIGTSICGFDCW